MALFWFVSRSDEVVDNRGEIQLCAEACRYGQPYCNLVNQWPTPACASRSTTLLDDVYLNDRRYKTNAEARLLATASKERCGQMSHLPAMWPDEIEFIMLTMKALKPESYLEVGGGQSSSFYPLFARRSVVVDHHPPWCDKIAKYDAVACLAVDFKCGRLTKDGAPINTGAWGTVDAGDAEAAVLAYIALLDPLGTFDAVLVDGRARFATLLALRPHLHDRSVVFVHDFSHRKQYHGALQHYSVLGYTRSVVALRLTSRAPERIPLDFL